MADTTRSPHTVDRASEPRFTVGTVARRVGVPTATLRSWNQRYGVGPLGHSRGRHRLYSDNDIAVVRHMRRLIGQGANPRSAARAAVEVVRPAPADVSSLATAAFALDVTTAERLIDGHLRHYGVLQTWEQLVRPAFAEIESRQAGGDRCIDVEHALSWTVVRSLQRLPVPEPDAESEIILSCTDEEHHTLPLEALRAALGERGCRTVMLGAAVPVDAVLDALGRRSRPATVVLWSQSTHTADRSALRTLRAGQAKVVLAGPGWRTSRLPKDTTWVESLAAAVEHLLSK